MSLSPIFYVCNYKFIIRMVFLSSHINSNYSQFVYKVNDLIFDVMIILFKNVGNPSIDFTDFNVVSCRSRGSDL